MAGLYNWLPCFNSSSSSSTNPKNRLGYEKVRLHEELGAGKVGRGGYRHTYDYKKDVTPIVSRASPRRIHYTTTPSPPPAYRYQYVCPPAPTPPPVYCAPPPPPPPPPPHITYNYIPPKTCAPIPNPRPIPVITKQNFVSSRPPPTTNAIVVAAPIPPPAYMPSRVEMEMHARTAGPPAQNAHIHYATGGGVGKGYVGVGPRDNVSCGIPSTITTSSSGSGSGSGISAPLPPKGMTRGVGNYYTSPGLGLNSGRHPIYAGHPFSGGGHYDPLHRDYTNRAILSTQPPRMARQTTFDPGYWRREPKNGYALPPLPLLPPLPPLAPMQTLPVYQPYQAYGAYNAYAPYQLNYQMVNAPPVPPIPQGHERAHVRRAPAPARGAKAVKMVAPTRTVLAAPVATGVGHGCQTTSGFPSYPAFPAFPDFPNFPNFPNFPKYPARC